MQKLLKYRADPKVLNKNGWTILYLAIKHRDVGLAQRLLDQSVSPNIWNDFNGIALYTAAIFGGSKCKIDF